MNASELKQQIIAALEEAVAPLDWVDSATVTGSFTRSAGLAGISDIDFVVVVEHLNASRFAELQQACRAALTNLLARAGFKLRINPTLGPLKLNDAQTAVLHLMIYSRAAHVDHVLQSPFTCLDWQRSTTVFKRSLADVFPVFGLQPRHFLGARRSLRDYLKDYRARRISYRELDCTADGYCEVRRELPMETRDRVEFAWHIVRFLMENVLKLVHRTNEPATGSELCEAFLTEFGEGADDVRQLYRELAARKKSQDFTGVDETLDVRLEAFVESLERQFRQEFDTRSTRHIVFRHAQTAWNAGNGDARRFQGRSDIDAEPIERQAVEPLVAALEQHAKARPFIAAFSSPLKRCLTTYAAASAHCRLPKPTVDDRLIEIDYGTCDGLTVTEARRAAPHLFAAWQRGEDPRFPGGESLADVRSRVKEFIDDRWGAAHGDTLCATHNGVLRVLIAEALGVPPSQQHRLRVAHLAPYAFIHSPRYGLFADFDESLQRETFADFVMNGESDLAAAEPPKLRRTA